MLRTVPLYERIYVLRLVSFLRSGLHMPSCWQVSWQRVNPLYRDYSFEKKDDNPHKTTPTVELSYRDCFEQWVEHLHLSNQAV
jgi:hypothetical protein